MKQFNLKNDDTGEIVGSADTLRGAWELAPKEVRDYALNDDGCEAGHVSVPLEGSGERVNYTVETKRVRK